MYFLLIIKPLLIWTGNNKAVTDFTYSLDSFALVRKVIFVTWLLSHKKGLFFLAWDPTIVVCVESVGEQKCACALDWVEKWQRAGQCEASDNCFLLFCLLVLYHSIPLHKKEFHAYLPLVHLFSLSLECSAVVSSPILALWLGFPLDWHKSHHLL